MNDKIFNENNKRYEAINLEQTDNSCGLCEKRSTAQIKKGEYTAIISCEGSCLRGEISRRVANSICFKDYPEKTARICLNGAFTKDTGQRNLVRSAKRVVIIEGCFLECASRMISAILPDTKTEMVILDKHYSFDKNLFAANEVSENEMIKFSEEAAINTRKIINILG